MTTTSEQLSRLTFDLTGVYEVTTESGTVYTVDLDAKTLRREVGIPTHRDAVSEAMRRDGDTVDLLDIGCVQVGLQGIFRIDLRVRDVDSTNRFTTTIVSIEAKSPAAE